MSIKLICLVVLFASTGAIAAVAQESNIRDPQTGLTYEQTVEMNRLVVQSNALIIKNDWANARPLLEQICKLNIKPSPRAAGEHRNLAIAYQLQGNTKEALREFQISFDMNPNASTARSFASCYFALGDTENGKLWLNKCIALAQNTDPALCARAKLTLATMSQAGATPGIADKNSPDYLSDLFNGKGGRWPSEKMPLKVFFKPADSVMHYRKEFKSILENAFNQWATATEGRLQWIEVSTSDNADIVCAWEESPDAAASEGGYVDHKGDTASDGTWILEHANLTLFTLSKDPFPPWKLLPLSDKQAQYISAHEVGHALGMYGHSSNSDDIMFYIVSMNPKTQLSQRDKNTILLLYKSYPVKEKSSSLGCSKSTQLADDKEGI